MHKMSKYKLNFVTYFCQIELFAKSLILFRVTRVVSINLFFKYFFDNQWVILWIQPFNCEYCFSSLYDSKLNIFGLLTKQDIWGQSLVLFNN